MKVALDLQTSSYALCPDSVLENIGTWTCTRSLENCAQYTEGRAETRRYFWRGNDCDLLSHCFRGRGQNGCNLLLFLVTKHDFGNLREANAHLLIPWLRSWLWRHGEGREAALVAIKTTSRRRLNMEDNLMYTSSCNEPQIPTVCFPITTRQPLRWL